MRDRMRRDPTGRDILRRRPRITDDFLEGATPCPRARSGRLREVHGEEKVQPQR